MDIIQKIEGSNVDGVYNLPKKHLNGRVFFSIPDLQLLTPEKYLDCIKLLKPLFKVSDFRDITPGFYINYIKDADVPNGGLRLNYYTANATETIKAIDNYANENSEKIVLFKLENASLDSYYWKDLIYYHGENRVGLHFLVNMVAVDENYTYDPRFFEENWFL